MSGRVALIIPYFGALPRWFPYWVKSLGRSPIFDAHLFTDAVVPGPVPGNLKIHPFSIAKFNLLASEKLGLTVDLKMAYKLCDFKPAFAEIFADYIDDYEFWAFGDLDVVYGDVQSFLKPLLGHPDVISFRKGWISGSLCILRNSKSINSLYKHSSDWKNVLSFPRYLWFDEMGGFFYSAVLGGVDVLHLKGTVESFTHVVKKQHRNGSIRCVFSDLACEEIPWGETLTYDYGKLKRLGAPEVMYIHYVSMRRRFFVIPETSKVPDRFYVRKTGIYLNRFGATSVCTREASRIALGSLRGAGRLVRRYALPNLSGQRDLGQTE